MSFCKISRKSTSTFEKNLVKLSQIDEVQKKYKAWKKYKKSTKSWNCEKKVQYFQKSTMWQHCLMKMSDISQISWETPPENRIPKKVDNITN